MSQSIFSLQWVNLQPWPFSNISRDRDGSLLKLRKDPYIKSLYSSEMNWTCSQATFSRHCKQVSKNNNNRTVKYKYFNTKKSAKQKCILFLDNSEQNNTSKLLPAAPGQLTSICISQHYWPLTREKLTNETSVASIPESDLDLYRNLRCKERPEQLCLNPSCNLLFSLERLTSYIVK